MVFWDGPKFDGSGTSWTSDPDPRKAVTIASLNRLIADIVLCQSEIYICEIARTHTSTNSANEMK
jgi:hypothetical protein